MEITGRLIKILQEVRGESQRGPWVRGGFVIETDGDYPRQVAFTSFGEDRLAMIKSIPINSPVVVTFNPESREYEGRWFTDLRCVRVQSYVAGQMPHGVRLAAGSCSRGCPHGATGSRRHGACGSSGRRSPESSFRLAACSRRGFAFLTSTPYPHFPFYG